MFGFVWLSGGGGGGCAGFQLASFDDGLLAEVCEGFVALVEGMESGFGVQFELIVEGVQFVGDV